MIALIVSIGEELLLEVYESRLLDIVERFDVDEERRRDVRILENERDPERDWKREVRMIADDSRSRSGESEMIVKRASDK